MAIAIAGELGPIEAGVVRSRLDLLADRVGPLGGLEPMRSVERLLELGERGGLGCGLADRPEDLLIDHVLETRRGHPLALAIVYSAVARRAGLELHPVGTERFVLLGDPAADPPLAIDPVPGGRRPPRSMRWLCPHTVGALMLGGLAARWRQRGDLRRAVRSLELRMILPLAPPLRARHERELLAMRATLN